MAKRVIQRTREQIIRRRILVLAVVVAVLLSAVAAYKLIVRKPSLPAAQDPSADLSGAENPGLLSGDRKKDYFTFLIVGRDSGGGGNTDTIMVVSYDVPNQKINVLNIFRDTMVNVPWEIKKINSVYNASGIDGLKQQIAKLIGFAPDYYVKVELDAFGELVDAIGGVDFDIPYDMNYDDPTQDLHIHFEKGMQHLSGDDAMRVIRWRKNNDGTHVSVGDVGRVQIQQDFVRALAKQCLSIGNITKVGEFARIFNTRVDSDLTLGELIWFGQQALGMSADNLAFHTLPGDYNAVAWSRTYRNYQSYVLPYGDKIAEMINEYFNPYDENVTTDMLDIMSINSDGSLSASGGVLADEKAGQAPVITTSKPKSTSETETQNGDSDDDSPAPQQSAAPEATPTPAPEASAAPEETAAPEVTPTPEPPEATEAPQTTDNLLPAVPAPAAT